MDKFKIEGSYIQYAAGYDKEGVAESDFLKALADLRQMDEEHGGFWISVYGADTDEFVLELHKDLTLFGNFSENENFKVKLKNLESSKEYFELLLDGMIHKLKEKFKNN
jgi:antirestriction protein